MGKLDFIFHNDGEISIKDTEHDLDLSDKKWDSLLTLFSNDASSIYFYGMRINYREGLEETILYLTEEMLIDERGLEFVLLKLKKASVMINRGLLGGLWRHYENPSLIFLKEKESEQLLVNAIKDNRYYKSMLRAVNGLSILYQSFEPEVLWINSNNIGIIERSKAFLKEGG